MLDTWFQVPVSIIDGIRVCVTGLFEIIGYGYSHRVFQLPT